MPKFLPSAAWAAIPTGTEMTGLQFHGVTRQMTSDERADVDAILRTLRLAQAQLQTLKKHFRSDPNRAQELGDIEVALDLVLKRLTSLTP